MYEGLIVASAGPDVICQHHNEVLATPRWEDEQKQIPQPSASSARSLSRLPFVCLSPPPATSSCWQLASLTTRCDWCMSSCSAHVSNLRMAWMGSCFTRITWNVMVWRQSASLTERERCGCLTFRNTRPLFPRWRGPVLLKWKCISHHVSGDRGRIKNPWNWEAKSDRFSGGSAAGQFGTCWARTDAAPVSSLQSFPLRVFPHVLCQSGLFEIQDWRIGFLSVNECEFEWCVGSWIRIELNC